MLGLMVSTQAATQKPNFDINLVESWKQSAIKHSIEKPVLLNFVNLSTTFCTRL